MRITLHSIQPTLHELEIGLKELYGDRLAYIQPIEEKGSTR